MRFTTLLVFTILANWFASCTGQNTPAHKQASAPNSAPLTIGDTVSAINGCVLIVFQAANGDFWFGGTDDGVYRYDGKNILHFSTKDGLCNNSVREIKEDRSGNIFFSTQNGGISKFDGNKFATLPVSKSNAPEKDWKLAPDDLWFKGETGKNGPYRYDGKTLFHLEFPKHYLADAYYAQYPDKSWSPYEVYHIYTDKKGNVWFGTSNFGVCRYDGKSLSWLYEDHLTNTDGGGSFGIRSIFEDSAGKFWFCNTRNRYVISPDSTVEHGKNLIQYQREKGIEDLKAAGGMGHVYFMSILEDDHQHLWMATYSGGVWRYDGKTATHYPVRDGAKDITLFSIYKDRQGGLWLGTHEAGVYKFNGKKFEKFNP